MCECMAWVWQATLRWAGGWDRRTCCLGHKLCEMQLYPPACMIQAKMQEEIDRELALLGEEAELTEEALSKVGREG